jgi:hypothetical protein
VNLPELASIIQTLWNVLVQVFHLLMTVIKNPVVSIVVGAILAFGARHVIYGVGLALVIYGALSLISSWLGVKFVP